MNNDRSATSCASMTFFELPACADDSGSGCGGGNGEDAARAALFSVAVCIVSELARLAIGKGRVCGRRERREGVGQEQHAQANAKTQFRPFFLFRVPKIKISEKKKNGVQKFLSEKSSCTA